MTISKRGASNNGLLTPEYKTAVEIDAAITTEKGDE